MTMKLGIEQEWRNRFLEIKDMRIHFSSVIRRAGLRLAERNLRVSARRIWNPLAALLIVWGPTENVVMGLAQLRGFPLLPCQWHIHTHEILWTPPGSYDSRSKSLFKKEKKRKIYYTPVIDNSVLWWWPRKIIHSDSFSGLSQRRTMACSYDH